MKEGLVSFNWPDMDKLHPRINGSTICDIAVPNHAYLGWVIHIKIFGHGDLKSPRIRFGWHVSNYLCTNFQKRFKTVFPGVGINGHFKPFFQHGTYMIYDRLTELTLMVGSECAVSIY
ncbi:MAG: hypothetical protein F3740_07555 [Nitrospinae bacterium]|nr:hypothetical protein [Nitrospinota bacterium]